MAGLSFAFTGDNTNFMRALNEITQGVQSASQQIEKEGVSIEDFFNRVKNIGAISFAGFGLGEMVKKIANTRAYFQDIESSMKVFLGSAEAGAEFTKKLQDYAYYNMFEFADLAGASKQLIAYGNDVNDVIDIIDKLSNVATATNVPLEEMVGLYNKAKSTGVVGAQDIASWAAKGLILKDVMKEMGTYVEGQTISFKQLNQVLDKVTAEGGMFHGIMDAQMTNISANIGQLQDNLSLMFNEMGEYLQEPIYEALQYAGALVENWKEVGYAIASVIAATGTQKGIDLITASIDKTATQAAYAAEQAQLEQLLGKKKEEAQSSIEQAVASGQLTQAKADEILALREEVHAQIEAITVKEKAAIIEESSVKAKLANAEAELAAADELVASYYEKLEAVMATGDAEAIETAVSELETAETLRNEAANIANAASEEAKAASKNVSTLAAEKEALATGLETSATTQQTFATRILTSAKIALGKATAKLNAIIAANPYAIAIAGAAALGYGIYKLATYETDLEKSLRKVKEAMDETNSQYEQEIKTLHELDKRLTQYVKGSNDWKAAKDAVVKQYGQYLPKLDEEISKTGTLVDIYDQLTDAIKRAQTAKGLKNFLDSNDNSQEVAQKWLDGLDDFKSSASGKITQTGQNLLEPILREFANNYVGDQDIFSYVQDKLKQREGIDRGQFLYETYEKSLKRTDLKKIIEAQKMNRTAEFELQRYVKGMGIDKGTLDEVRYGIEQQQEESEAQNKKFYENEKKRLEGQLAELTYEQAQSEEGQKIKAEIEKVQQKLEAYSIKKQSGQTAEQTASKVTAEHQKYLDLLKQQEEERLRLQQQYILEEWQNRINLMDDGEQKVLSQMALNHQKENIALDQQKQQAINDEIARQKAIFDAREDELAAVNKKYAKKVFDPTKDVDQSEIDKIVAQYATLQTQLTAIQAKAEQDRRDQAQEAMNNYLKEFGTYAQKIKAIKELYQSQIDEAPNLGARLQAIANRNKELSELDFNEWQDNGGMSMAFGDISKLSKNTIQELIANMEQYRSKIIATFDPDKILKFEEALANLRSAEMDFTFNFSGDNDIVESLKERLSLQKQIADIEANQNEMLNQKKAIEEELNTLTMQMMQGSLNTSAIDPNGESTEYGLVTEEMVNRANELRVKLNEVTKSLQNSTNRSKELNEQLQFTKSVKFADVQKFSNNLLKAGKNASELASIFGDDLADAIGEGVEKLGGMFDAFTELSSNIELLAKAGKDVVKETTDASKQVVDAASGGMKASAAATATSLSTMEKASAILAIIGAAIQLATMIASLFNSDKKHQKNIENLQKQIDALQNSYDKLSRSIDKAYSADASNLIEQQNKLLQQQKVLIRQQMAEEQAKKKTDDDKIQEYKDRLQEIDKLLEDNKDKAKEAIIGEDLKSAINEFADALKGAWEDGTDAAQKATQVIKNLITSALTETLKSKIQPYTEQFYNYLAEAMKKGYLSDSDLNYLDNLQKQIVNSTTQLQEEYQKILERYKDIDELREELTDISFDSLSDNFKSMLLDMESSAQDFSDNFEDMLRNALIEGLMNDKYDIMLKEWYDEFAEAMMDHTLSNEERNALKQKYDAIVQQGIEDRKLVNEIVGGGSGNTQNVSTGNAWNMSQETGEELNGRFTAMVELEAINNTLVSDGNFILRDILSTLRSVSGVSMVPSSENGDTTLIAIKDMMFLSTGYLEDIARYTKFLIEMNGVINEMNSNIKKL